MDGKLKRSPFGEPGLSKRQKTKDKESRIFLHMICLFAFCFGLFISAQCWAFGGGGAGGGAASGVSAPPFLLMPSPPRNVTATAGNGMATVSFDPPKTDGGSPVTEFTVTSHPGRIKARGTKSPIAVNGLSNGKKYSFTVTASNSVGTGPTSEPSNCVTPGEQQAGSQSSPNPK